MPGEVLLVDDERLVAKLYARAVEAAGYTPAFAEDGETALERVLADPPGLLVTDLNMPRLAGDRLAETIISRGRKSFPILLMSAEDTPALIMAGVRSGVDDFLVKGASFERFRGRLDYWLSGPFRGLPPHIRAEAAESLARQVPPSPPIERLHGPIDTLSVRALITVEDLIEQAGPDFGARPVDLIRLTGVIDGVVGLIARSNGLAQLRRLEVIGTVVTGLGPPWTGALASYIERFEAVSLDPLFQHAAQSLKLTL